jgi:hypothetical protein
MGKKRWSRPSKSLVRRFNPCLPGVGIDQIGAGSARKLIVNLMVPKQQGEIMNNDHPDPDGVGAREAQRQRLAEHLGFILAREWLRRTRSVNLDESLRPSSSESCIAAPPGR